MFIKGQIPWNKGKKGIMHAWNKGLKMSLEHRKKLSDAQKRNPVRYWLGKKRSTGKNAANWKGGKTPRNHHYLSHPKYKFWRKSVFERDNYTCVICKKGGIIQADHILRWIDYPKLRFNINNGQTLCIPCHKIKTRIERKNTL